MESFGIVGIVLILVNLLVSYQGLKDHAYLDRYAFNIDKILVLRQYYRLFSSAFLHVSWSHLLFNMMALYLFSSNIEGELGILNFCIIYFGSLLGGGLLSLFIHRHDSTYTAVGASGAISGLVFASIAMFPHMRIGLFLVPMLSMPAWLFGFLYVLYSIYGIKSKRDNIGHDAHLGGGIVGLMLAIIIHPYIFQTSYFAIFLMLVPSLVFLFYIVKRPEILFVDSAFSRNKGSETIDDRFNASKIDKEKELDYLLDKIGKKGMNGLSEKEKERLKHLSGR
jgi:membrane associated rhomboid family serine protease